MVAENYFEHPSSGCRVSYETILEAMRAKEMESYQMSLVGDDRAALIAAVNQGIDSHLEIVDAKCVAGKRSFKASQDARHWKAGDEVVYQRTLEGDVPAEFLPTLIRRLAEADDEVSQSLAGDILSTLDIDEYSGKFEPDLDD